LRTPRGSAQGILDLIKLITDLCQSVIKPLHLFSTLIESVPTQAIKDISRQVKVRIFKDLRRNIGSFVGPHTALTKRYSYTHDNIH
jgi:hypothetical protein